MSMHNDINWWTNKNESVRRENAKRVAAFAENFKPGRWSFLCLGDEEKWYGSLIDKPEGLWNSIVEIVTQEFAKSGHHVFMCSSPLSRGVLKRKGGGRISIYYIAEPKSAERFMNTIVSVNQLNISRAVLILVL